MQEQLAKLFESTFGAAPDTIDRVTPDGSQRMYYRLRGAPHGTVIGAHGPDSEENRAFLSFSRSFAGIGLPVPEIFAADDSNGLWLETDLGDTTLFAALSLARDTAAEAFPATMLPVYERVVDLLPRFQVEGGNVIDFDVAYPRPAFDRQSMEWDLDYFKYHFLKLAHIPFNEQRLQNDFDRLIAFLLDADTRHFLYRDFQSRNVMLLDGEPWFIDYQGGRRGAPQYDIASLLYDAKADIPGSVRERLLARYMIALARVLEYDEDRFVEHFRGYVLVRVMQAMGAYGYRGFYERKTRFLESVPYAARNIAHLLDTGLPVRLPELETVFRRIVDAWADEPGPVAPLPGLTVRISSFSYKRGYPVDETGHGGGFVFDCRSLPNPGRQAAYTTRTGLDADVIAFLEAAPEVGPFWESAVRLADAHVADYRRRGFHDTAIAFGCTGGQHRSVYFAERLSRYFRERYPDVIVRLEHRERRNWPERAPDQRSRQDRAGAEVR